MASKTDSDLHIRWMIRRDLPEVLAIDKAQFAEPWDKETFVQYLRQRNCIGMVVERDDRIVGVMIYELHKTRLVVIRLAVDTDASETGIGRAMIDKLKGKILTHCTRHAIRVVVDTDDIGLCMFLSEQGFVSRRTADGFVMEFDTGPIRKTLKNATDRLYDVHYAIQRAHEAGEYERVERLTNIWSEIDRAIRVMMYQEEQA